MSTILLKKSEHTKLTSSKYNREGENRPECEKRPECVFVCNRSWQSMEQTASINYMYNMAH